MKASEIARYFASLASFEPDMEVAILWWEQPKGEYEYGSHLSKEQWSAVVRNFESDDYVSQDADEFIMREIAETKDEE